MIRLPWRASVTVATLVALTGCGWLPGSSGPVVDAGSGFALMVQAPDAYRGNSSVSMRFNMPRRSGYSVAALASDIDRINVTLLEMGAISMPADIPMPTPVSMPAVGPTAPSREPIKPPPTEPWPSDLEDFPTILPDNPTQPVGRPAPPKPMPPDMAPPPDMAILPAPMPMPGAKPLVSSPIVAEASISKRDLDKGQGDVVFNDLKAGVYGIQIVALDREGHAIGKSMQSVQVLDGETTSVDTRLVLSGSGNVSVGVTIIEGQVGDGGGAVDGSIGGDVATASPVLPPPPPVPMPWPRKGG